MLKIADTALSFKDDGKPFIAITLYQDTATGQVADEILARLCQFEQASGKSVMYALDGHNLHIVPSETDIHEVIKMAEKIVAHLTDSITPINIMVRRQIRYIHDRFPSAKNEESPSAA